MSQAYLTDFGQTQRFPLLHAHRVRAELDRLSITPPKEFMYANSFWNPRGREHATAWVLMSRGEIIKLRNANNNDERPLLSDPGIGAANYGQSLLESLLTLVFDDTGPDGTPSSRMAFPDLVWVQARRLIPGIPEDDNAPYLVELADSRYRLHNPYFSQTTGALQRVNATCSGKLLATTEDNFPTGIYAASNGAGGDLWTWQEMVNLLWIQMQNQLGSSSATLPFTPEGTPHDWHFLGTPCWLALCEVLDHLTCAVSFNWDNPTTPYSIVRVGVDTAGNTALATTLRTRGRLIHDDEPFESVRARMPSHCTVLFNKRRVIGDTNTGTDATTEEMTQQPVTEVREVAVSVTIDYGYGEASGERLGSASLGQGHGIWDDTPVMMQVSSTSTAATNTDWDARADERAEDYARRLQNGGWLYQQFSGLWPFKTDGMLSGVAWRQVQAGPRAGGWMTEIVRTAKQGVRPGADGRWEPIHPAYPASTQARPPMLGPIPPGHPHLAVYVYAPDFRDGDGSGVATAEIHTVDPGTGPGNSVKLSDCYVFPVSPMIDDGMFVGRIVGNYDDGTNGVRPLVAVNAHFAPQPGGGTNYDAGTAIPVGSITNLYLPVDAYGV